MVGTQLAARDLFRAAYENRYTWDAAFPGYTADVTFTHNGQTHSGQVKVSADLKLEVSGIADEAAQKMVHGQLFEVSIHRVRREFEDSHSNNTFRYGDTLADGSVEILMGGKAEGDRYQLKDNEVSMVHRHIHGVVVTIHTYSSHDTGSGYLSHRYDSVYHDPKTGDQKGGLSDFEDEYTEVGGYYILSRRAIETSVGDDIDRQEFVFSNIALIAV
ncbi:DUF3386 domain-containing protein [Phormidium tenue]|uniref:DUF3386 domain-containing protein n=1 Tax=Phormidium tenue NIES-30 TaxID=549789 RepID=A0A1U7J2Z1_9CYAN|nr:DUF3386 domain-containing protein [Phormidium tenue]MBD2231820.1 DUF3386 domain-containing protein [Phormidium tenue FACHB-1052]OKH46466.1 hypothetical protein NIES30_16930 [Phormidium tenue NIES-30]